LTKKLVNLRDLAAPGTQAPKYAELARATEWKPGQKLYFSKHPPVTDSADLARVLALPKRPPLDLESPLALAMARDVTARWSRGERQCACATIDPKIAAGKRRCIKDLKPIQAWALREMGMHGGLIAQIPTGSGKTLCSILAPLALAPLGAKNCLLLIPPSLQRQLERDYRLIAEHFQVPLLRMHGFKIDGREVCHDAQGPRLHVMPYSRLSRPDASNWIRNLRPDAVIADEVQRLRDPQGAGSSRVIRYFVECGETMFVGYTGTLTENSLSDYAHLAALALRERSPVPLDKMVVAEWGRALDESESPAPPGALRKLCDEDIDPETTEGVREGFCRRLESTPGVVISTTASVDSDVVIEERPAPPIPPTVAEGLRMVRELWVRPDTLAGAEHDEELEDAMEVARVARELASGVFYYWHFPHVNGAPQRRETIDEWYEARAEFKKELRKVLMDREEWLDSPLLCEHAAQRHHGQRPKRDDRPEWASRTWMRWWAIKDKVVHETRARRVSDYLVADSARWALETRGVLWYGMAEFGKWVAELSGLPLHGGGPGAEEALFKEDGSRSIIASIKSHGTGRDGLQMLFCNQHLAQPPASNTQWAQTIARLWRDGQTEDVVRCSYYAHTEELRASYEKALRRAEYVRGTTRDTSVLLR
jgi:hypothetical protein